MSWIGKPQRGRVDSHCLRPGEGCGQGRRGRSVAIANRPASTAVNTWKTTEPCVLHGRMMWHVNFFNEAVIKPKRKKLENSPFPRRRPQRGWFHNPAVALVRQWHFCFLTVSSLFCEAAFLKTHAGPQKPHIAGCCLSPVWVTLSIALCPLVHASHGPSLSPSLLRKASSKCLGCLMNLVTWACCGVFGHRRLRCQRCQAQRVTNPASCVQVSVPTQEQGELRPFSCSGTMGLLYLGYPYTCQQGSSASSCAGHPMTKKCPKELLGR